MSYIVPIHEPNSIRYAVKIKLLSTSEECLVVAKVNRIEIYEQTAGGLVSKYSTTVYGTIISLQKVRIPDAIDQPEVLIVVTDRQCYFTLTWNHEESRLECGESYLDEGMGQVNESMNSNTCLVDPTDHLLVLDFFDGLKTIVPLNVGKRKNKKRLLGSPALQRTPELLVRSSAFLYGLQKSILVLLWEDAHGEAFLKGKEVISNYLQVDTVAEFLDTKFTITSIDNTAIFVIPIPDTIGGMLVVSESSLHYLSFAGEKAIKQLSEPTVFCAWETIDGPRHLLADDYGYLYLLTLQLSNSSNIKIDLTKLGKIPRASVLLHLDNGLVFVGSTQGDSQVIRLQQDQPIAVLQTLPNISPVLDFAIMDMGNPTGESQTNEFSSGQSRIVTGSGSFESGSLRSVRSGVALHDIGSLAEIDGIRNIFNLSSSGDTKQSDILLVSKISETRIFTFSPDGEAEEVEELKAILVGEETLEASNCAGGLFVQVTGSTVRTVDFESGTVISEWSSPAGKDSISTASINDDYIAIVVKGADVVILNIGNGLAVESSQSFKGRNQVSCIFLPPVPSKVCVVGFWTGGAVSLLDISTLRRLHTESIGDADGAVPRSLLLTQVLEGQLPTLLVGMADGLVYSFSADLENYSLTNKRATILGTEQPKFKALPRSKNIYSVYATCEHPSLIYGADGRIVFSSVTAEKAVAVCDFNAAAFPGSIVIATEDELRLTAVDTERTTHVRTLPLQTTVRRIAHSRAEKAFALGTVDRTLRDHAETNQSRVMLVDEIMFEDLDKYNLKPNELIECVARAQLPFGARPNHSERNLAKGGSKGSEYFLAGTSFLDQTSRDATRGRIVVFEISSDRKLQRVAEVALKGACRCIASYGEYIVAALSRTVAIFQWGKGPNEPPSLTKIATYRTSNTPISLSVSFPSIVVADIMKSITVLHFNPSPTPTLTEIARHFSILWSTAVTALSPTLFLVADAASNLLLLRHNDKGPTPDDQRRLEVLSEIHVGEQINRLEAVEVQPSPDAAVVPVAFAATAQGGVYLIGSIGDGFGDRLLKLQNSLAGPGGAVKGGVNPESMEWMRWRGFRNTSRSEAEPYRFVDGEMIERFLDLDESVQRDVAGNIDVDVEELRELVETLRRLH
ncbi:MAG: hypothetical protein M1814_000220 [Vezdaea aestivalis]|nr:MAG: hypothetical protein M1814_000220 [Vezdaea aestivalis]